jgi:hypothetical protein
MIPQMIIRQGIHWKAKGKRQEKDEVLGTLDAP